MKKIILTGGGTAGHVTPNLALLPALREEDFEIHYIGSYNGIERRLIEAASIPYDGISSGKLRRYFDLKNFSDPLRVLKGYFEARKLMKKYKPDIVILDIQMPLMTGMEAAQWIHENYPDIVVVLLTAYEDFKYAQQAIVFQVKRYVIKSNLFEDLPKALEEISEELKKDNRSEKNRTEVYAGQKNKLNDNELNKIVCNIISCMQSGDENVCMEEMQKLRSAIRDYSDSYIRSAAILFISECHRLYIEYGDDEVTGFDMEQEDAINLILETKRIIEIEDCLESMMLSFVRKKNKKIQTADELIDSINKFIEKNYTKKISLDLIADAVHANRCYISRIYQDRTGEKLFETINRKKIEIARKYIEDGKMRVYEIADSIGWEDTAYFSRVFKKYTGYSPKEYEKLYRR